MKIAVIIPSYRVTQHIEQVIQKIPDAANRIYVVDDSCPDASGKYVMSNVKDPRVSVIFNDSNLGVGGATKAGMNQALIDGMEILIKIDGDGQMDPTLLTVFTKPIISGEADFTKGNRFYFPDSLAAMPKARLFANALYSFMAKLSTGYWQISDPVNGYIAIDARVYSKINRSRVSNNFFFESDLLFHLGISRAKVVEIPMRAHYASERSNLRIAKNLWNFVTNSISNLLERIYLRHFLMDFSFASLELMLGIPMCVGGLAIGTYWWIEGLLTGRPATPGMVMLPALLILVGLQFILSFLAYDIQINREPPVSSRLTY